MKGRITNSKIRVATALLAGLLPVFCYAEELNKNGIIQYQQEEPVKTDKTKPTHFTSGTGFFVTSNDIVTNEHVVQDCKYIKVRGAIDTTYVTVTATDKASDLALLKSIKSPHRVAELRPDTTPLNNGDEVVVIGFPMENGITGRYDMQKATITNTDDVYDGISRIQFTDTVRKGNSGGPLMDNNGNVVGVVAGKMSFFLADASSNGTDIQKPVKTSSVAVSLTSLKDFLTRNNIYYKEDQTIYNYPDNLVETKAQQYIVNIHCVK